MSTRGIGRRALLRRGAGIAGGIAVSALFAACGETDTPTATTAPAATGIGAATMVAPTRNPPTGATGSSQAGAAMGTATTAPPAATIEGKIPSPLPGVGDAYEKDPPVFKATTAPPGRGGKVTTLQSSNKPPIVPKEQNPYWQELERRLGVTWEPTFVPGAAYDERLSALVAGNDLPDFVVLGPSASQTTALLQGAYADLTPHLTGDALKEYPNLASFPPQLWKNIAINGKVYGVPRPRTLAGSPLALRQDWAEKLDTPAPKNADEFFALMVDMTKKDPDGNGTQDTFGLGSSIGDVFSLTFLQQMFRVPNEWRLNADGTLTNHIETEEFRAAVAYARKLNEAGGYVPDAATLNSTQASDNFTSGKTGAYPVSLSGFPLNTGAIAKPKQLNPAAKVVAFVPPGHDGSKAVTYNGLGTLGFTAISARAARDRERLKELLRILDYFAVPFGSEEQVFLRLGLPGRHYRTEPDGTRIATDVLQLEKHDLNLLTATPWVWYYPGEPGIPTYLQSVARDLIALAVENPTTGLFSRTNAMKGIELNQLRTDRLVGIVTGREPLGALDAYIRDWRSRGGDQIRKEYQDALKA